jgi:hypothetical protein
MNLLNENIKKTKNLMESMENERKTQEKINNLDEELKEIKNQNDLLINNLNKIFNLDLKDDFKENVKKIKFEIEYI